MQLPIMQGRLKGKKWIVGSSTHGCWLGSYEFDKQQIFENLITEGSVVFDIGGHVGFYSLLASDLVGKDGQVYVFEPLPRNLQYLKKHLYLNNIKNVVIIEAAVTDTDGFVYFAEGDHSSKAHINKNGDIRVKAVVLDKLIRQGILPIPNFIKVDIEGAELSALQGAIMLINLSHPTILLATHGENIHRDCCKFLEGLGYKIKAIDNISILNANEILASYSPEFS